MPLASTSASAMAAHLDELGVKPGDRLAVHSRLLVFGNVEGGYATVLNVLRQAVGPKGTLVVPTYTLDRTTVYDRATSPSQNVGVLPELLRQTEGAVRSACPMHNHAALGADAGLINLPKGRVSLGEGSDFELLLREGFRLLLLGAGVSEGSTFVHHVEAEMNVPYRTWLNLPRMVRAADGSLQGMVCRYFGRGDMPVSENFEVLEAPLLASQQMRKARAHYGVSRLVSLAALNEAARAALEADSYALVTK